ncbi:MAG: helix-turn-helix domain-containing protein [Muribaculum sp.]|nr:helix-turn-helix domain-containing protein [Muribaculum sp.]
MLKTLHLNKLLLCILLVIISDIFVNDANAEGRLFRQVTSGDYPELEQTTIYDIQQSNFGFVWFATDAGLYRFDGEHVVKIPLPDESAGSRQVKCLARVGGKGMLVGTPTNIFRLTIDGTHHKLESLLEGKSFSSSCGITTADGDAVIGGDDGLMIYSHKTGKLTHIRLSKDILNLQNNVIDLANAPNAIYALTKGGIFRIDPSSYEVSEIKTDLDFARLLPISIICSSEQLYIGTTGEGVYALNPISGKVSATDYVGSGKVVTSLCLDESGNNLFIGTDGGGITKVNLESGEITRMRHNVSDTASPSSNQVYAMLHDKNGLLWVGYYQHGIDYTPHSVGPFELFDDPAVFNSRGVPVRALAIGKRFNAIGTREGVVVHDKTCDEVWRVDSHLLRSEMVVSLLEKNGKIFVGTYGGGLQVLDPFNHSVSDFSPVTGDQVFRSGHIFSIANDNQGGVWFGTNEGLYYVDAANKVRHFSSLLTALPEGNVYCIFFDSEGKGWICTDDGVCVYDPDRKVLRTDIFPISFPKNTRFRSVYEDSRNRLYFVPESGYVYSCGLDFSNSQTLDNKLLKGTDAKSVIEDAFNDIWISTNRGIFRLDTLGNVRRFGLESGLPSLSFLQSQPVSDQEGGIWFGNAEGLLRLDENSIKSAIDNQQPPVPTKVEVNGEPTDIIPHLNEDGSYRIILETTVNNIKIGFSPLSYALQQPEAYEYCLDNGEWLPLRNDISVSFFDLKPGKHKLSVRSIIDSTDIDQTIVYFDIPYPLLWKVGIALIVVLLVVLVLISWNTIASLSKRDDPESDVKESQDSQVVTAPQKKYAANNMSRTEARQISAKIDEIMVKDRPYLDSDLKVAKLAELIGISSHKLSQFFSQHKDMSFYDYVNRYRVDEFKRMVKEEDVRNLTLSAMAEKAGFSSRASFFRYFKNIEGISPGEYLKSRQKP